MTTRETLPSLDEPEPGARCVYCGEPLRFTGPDYCAPCEDRMAWERRRQSADDYRRQAQRGERVSGEYLVSGAKFFSD